MKYTLILLTSLTMYGFCYGQKLSKNTYKNVDTIYQYSNASIIIYKDKFGYHKADTVYSNKQKSEVNIENVDEMYISDDKLKSK